LGALLGSEGARAGCNPFGCATAGGVDLALPIDAVRLICGYDNVPLFGVILADV